MHTLIHDFFQKISPSQTLWVAYSGGVDSHALLHMMVKANLPHCLRAVHVNHGLHPDAGVWAAHCQVVCEALGVPLTHIQIDAKSPPGESPEDYARKKRYEACMTLLNKGDALVSAHHREDQAETFLLQLLRGAGLPGLASMGEVRPLGEGWLLRPLLFFSRADLLRYAKENALSWVEDESNLNPAFNRNYIRRNIMPVLNQRWSGSSVAIARAAKHCAEAQALLNELAAEDAVKGRAAHTLSIQALHALSPLRQMNAIRYWLQSQQFLLPSEKQLHEIIKALVYSRQDAMPCMRLPHFTLRRFKDDLIATFPKKEFIPAPVIAWNINEEKHLSGIGKLLPQSENNAEAQRLFIPYAQFGKDFQISIRFRLGGEVFQPHGRAETHTLKKLMQAWQIPPWERSHIPLLYVNETLACVVGFAVAHAFIQKEKEAGEHFYFAFQPES